MIAIEFQEPADDDDDARAALWRRWRDACDEATQQLIESIERGDESVEINRALYGRRSIKKRFYCDPQGERFAPFFGKCVFCEIAKETLAIEHFRPKGAVTNAANRPIVRETADGATVRHRGYYWLAYDWRNLLLACDDCNGARRKGNRFPVENEATRAWNSSDDIEAEQPALINPLLEDPHDHLRLDVETGLLFHNSERGRVCIELLGLNRDPLPELRRDTVTRIRTHWVMATDKQSTHEERRKAVDYILDSVKGQFGFTMTARTCTDRLRPHR